VRGEAQRFAQARSRDLPALLIAAQALASTHDDAGARALISQASALDAHAPQPWVQLGWLEWSQHNYPAADTDFAQALQLAPKDDAALLGKAQSELHAGHLDTAIVRLEQVRAQAPRALPPRLALARLYLSAGRLSQASAVLGEAQGLAPKNPDARLLGALLALAQGHGPEAVSTLQQLAQQFPKAARVQADLARAYLLSGRIAEARAGAQMALKLDPDCWPALVTEVALALGQHDTQGANAALERLGRTSAPKATALALSGDIAVAGGRINDALQAFTAAYALAPSGGLAIQMATARRALHAADPEGPLREWLQRHPKDLAARLTLAQMLQFDGQSLAAAHEYESVLSQDGQQLVALNNLAWLKLASGDTQGALDLAHRAYVSNDGQPSVADTYGWALVQSGHAEDAVPVLRDAYGKMPGNNEVRYHLGAALVKSGAVQEGREQLKAVADSADRSPVSEQARSLLANLDAKTKG
jgi:putative PEP-CTERM system TPR-repeat lipoprotein